MNIKALNSTLQLYRIEAGIPKHDAQRNLSGRTHYVDDDTLQFFDSRINRTYILDEGLLYGLVESFKHPQYGRLFRPVIFDVFGEIIARPEMENCPKSGEPARKMFWRLANELDAVQVTLEGIERERGHLERKDKELMFAQQVLRKQHETETA